MKNVFSFCLLFLCIVGIYAQDDESDVRYVVGGSFNFFTQNNFLPSPLLIHPTPISGVFSDGNATSRWTNVRIQPYVGKEINSRLLIGLSAFFGTEKGTTEWLVFPGPGTHDTESFSQQWGLAVFSRHTLNPDQKFQFFLQPSVGYYFANQQYKVDSETASETQSYYLNIDLSAGMLYNLNQKWRATLRTAGIRYVYGQSKDMTDNTRDNFSSLSSDFRLSQLSFGLEMRF